MPALQVENLTNGPMLSLFNLRSERVKLMQVAAIKNQDEDFH